jgi:hypothetical protein
MMEDSADLNNIGVGTGTNKSTIVEGYLPAYGAMLAHFRNEPINLIEIGVADGASVAMWEKWLPRAQIVGIDIQSRCARFARGRVAIEIGSQADGAFLDDVLTRYPPTIMIDDGSHMADHIIATFERAWAKLLPGGCYIMEDLYVHAGAGAHAWRGNATMAPQDYVAGLLPNVLTHRAAFRPRDGHDIERIFSLPGAAMIFKSTPLPPWEDRLPPLRALAERGGKARNWQLLARMILAAGGPPSEAEAASRRAIEINPRDHRGLELLATALRRQGRIDEAAVELRAGIEAAVAEGVDGAATYLQGVLARITAPDPKESARS